MAFPANWVRHTPRSDALYLGNWESRTWLFWPPTLPVAPTVHYSLMNTGPASTVYWPWQQCGSLQVYELSGWAPIPSLPPWTVQSFPPLGWAAVLTFRGTTCDWCFSHAEELVSETHFLCSGITIRRMLGKAHVRGLWEDEFVNVQPLSQLHQFTFICLTAVPFPLNYCGSSELVLVTVHAFR